MSIWLRNTSKIIRVYVYKYTHTHTHKEVSMYINPFLAGIVFTVGTEILLLFGAALIATFKKGKKYGN